ncbi:MAG TPA: hypothetical protein VFY78_12580, partial [Gammaproteobacteria bacterium]|nr:hypothetical protein [Gammaproteobacteria bacterium]
MSFTFFLSNCLLFSLLVVTPVKASPGDPDTTFGSGGLVTTSVNTGNDLANALAVLPDGKILVAGRTTASTSDLNIALLRYNPDGSLDTTFDGDGIVSNFLGGDTTANAIIVTPDGSIYLAGRISGAFILAKFTSAGVLDTSFAAGNGYVIVDPDGSGNATCSGMAITPAGNFVLAGSADLGGGLQTIALVQINAHGTVDSSFGGGDGIVLVNPGLNTSHGHAIAVQPDGRILVTGDANGTSIDLAVLRFNSDGSADTTFDTDGVLTTDIGGFQDIGYAIALQPDRKILVAGSSGVSGSGNDFAVLRYLADGSLDTSFSSDGITTTAIATSYFSDKARALVIQPDGKIIAGGFARNATDSADDFAVARFNTNGSLDSSFGTGGITTTTIGGYSLENETGYALAMQTDGNVVLAESNNAGGTTQEIWMVRYLAIDTDNNPSPPEPWQITPAVFTFTETTGVAISSTQTSNNITVAGLGTGIYVPVRISGGEYAINGGSYT